jgi:CDP-diacylglycerol--serine O-phosphatidyltransferase
MYRTVLPNLFTIGNLFCGFLALHYGLKGSYTPAAWLIVLGAVLDKMDGKIARFVGKDSQFGIEFDSLVDICTFGVVPAILIYHSQLGHGWGLVVAFIYLLCGALRLARFNTRSLDENDEEKSAFYMGLPIPMAAVCLSQYVVFAEHTWESNHGVAISTLVVLMLSAMMVSRVEYDAMPNFRGSGFWDRFKQIYFVVAVTLIIHPDTQHLFFPLVMFYVLSGVYRWVTGVLSDTATQHA